MSFSPIQHTSSSNPFINPYRYGYNGMESDGEVKGDNNSYTTEFRQYDPRLGRWLSLDPMMMQFPNMSPYVAFDNNPIYYTDPLGLASEGGEGVDPAKGNSESNPQQVPEVTVSAKRDPLNVPKLAPRDNTNVVLPYTKPLESKQEYAKKQEKEAKRYAEEYKRTTTIGRPNKNQEFSEDMWDRYGDYVAPKELIEKLAKGEEISASDWIIEGVSIIPGGKILGKGAKIFYKAGDKTIDITNKVIKKACFVEGTKIKSKEGYKNIEEIQIGDKVWSFDENTGKIEVKAVLNTTKIETDHLQKLLIGFDTIFTTDEHPFYVSSSWKSASKLVVGDTLALANKEYQIVTYKERIDTLINVYNFTVEDNHTYFVGEQQILVHNDCSQPIKKTAQEIAKNCKKMTESQIAQVLGEGWHENGAKTKLVRKHGKALKGSTNADFYIDKTTNEILLKGNKSNAWVQTGLFLD